MTGDPELRALAAAFPSWRLQRSSRDGTYTAWRPEAGKSLPRLLRDVDVDGLRAQLEKAHEEGEPR